MTPRAVDPYDVAIILGARILADGRPSPAMIRRVERGVALLRQGRARALLMSGGVTGGDIAEAVLMRGLALAAGADPEAVHVEDRARDTIQNALFSAVLVRARGWRRLAVVTDSFHVPRVSYIFRRFGLAAAIIGVRPARPTRQWWLAHGREVLAMPWTILRVEAHRLGGLGRCP